MTPASQRKASNAYRQRESARGLVRVEVRATAGDATLIRSIADTLRSDSSETLRTVIRNAVGGQEIRSAFDIFGSDLPDAHFDGVFERQPDTRWRDVDF